MVRRELLGASCGPEHAPAEIIVSTRRRAQPRLRVRHGQVAPAETGARRGEVLRRPDRVAARVRRALIAAGCTVLR